MHILFVHVPVGPEKTFPLGLGYLSAAARDSGFHVTGLDLSEEGASGLGRRIQDPSVQWVGFSTFTRTWQQIAGLTRLVKSLRKDVRIVLGGPHATCLPEKVLEESLADVVVVGEGESTLKEILQNPDPKGWDAIPGIVFTRDGANVRTPAREPILPLDALPFPDRTLLPLHRYAHGMMAQAYPYAAMITSRGCNAMCTYCPCSRLWKGPWRERSPENVLEEMKDVFHRFQIRHFIMEDDQFMASGERVEEFCGLLRQTPLPFTWELSNGVSPEQLSPGQIPRLAQGGCRSLTLSLETRHLGKEKTGREPYRMESVRSLIRRCHEVGIFVGGYFLLGFPGEAASHIERNINDAKVLSLDSAHFSILVPLPGTRFYEDLEGFHEARLGTTPLRSFQKKAYRRFYLRPRMVWKVLCFLRKNPKLLRVFLGKAMEVFSLRPWRNIINTSSP